MKTFLALLFAASAALGGIQNANVVHHTGLAATLRALPNEWIAYEVPTPSSRYVMCCMDWISRSGHAITTEKTCRLGGGGSSFMGTISESAGRIDNSRMIVALHAGHVEVYSVGCPVDAGGKTVHAVDNVSTDESLGVLEGLVGGEHRHGALAAIAMHDAPRAAQVLERFATGNAAREVRGDAVFWLAQVGGRRGFEVTRKLANDDPDGEMRKKAIFALTQSPEEPGVYDALVSLVRNHPDTRTRSEAIFWLGQHEGQKALPVLREIFERDTDRGTREKAIFAISQVPGDEAVKLLIHLAHDDRDPYVRKQAIFWLGQKAETRISAIREAADRDPSSEVREMAVFAISQRPHDESIPALIELTHHKDPAVRKKAVFWLSQMDDPRALAAIEKMLLK
jgi:HEAT repeat protein